MPPLPPSPISEKLCQDQQRWPDSCPWFEHAPTTSLAANRVESKITKTLERAFENERHEISYLTYKTYEDSLRENGVPFQINNACPVLECVS
jgi:hypothetical protein